MAETRRSGQVVVGGIALAFAVGLAFGLWVLWLVFWFSPVGLGVAVAVTIAFGYWIARLARASRLRE